MISVGTKLRVADNSGAKLAKCLKTLGTANKKIAYVGGLILVALKRFKGKKKVSKNIVYIGLIIGQAF
jgi:large subunit ribosomal protein L14